MKWISFFTLILFLSGCGTSAEKIEITDESGSNEYYLFGTFTADLRSDLAYAPERIDAYLFSELSKNIDGTLEGTVELLYDADANPACRVVEETKSIMSCQMGPYKAGSGNVIGIPLEGEVYKLTFDFPFENRPTETEIVLLNNESIEFSSVYFYQLVQASLDTEMVVDFSASYEDGLQVTISSVPLAQGTTPNQTELLFSSWVTNLYSVTSSEWENFKTAGQE